MQMRSSKGQAVFDTLVALAIGMTLLVFGLYIFTELGRIGDILRDRAHGWLTVFSLSRCISQMADVEEGERICYLYSSGGLAFGGPDDPVLFFNKTVLDRNETMSAVIAEAQGIVNVIVPSSVSFPSAKVEKRSDSIEVVS